MAAGNTYTPIATQTLGSAAASVTFSSIPATYTDLVLVVSVVSSTISEDVWVRYNSDTSTNYSWTNLSGSGSVANSNAFTSQTYFRIARYGYTSTTIPSMHIVQIMNYSNSTTYKTSLVRAGQTSSGVDAVVGLWKATPAAINSILVSVNSGNFSIGTGFSLYGIAAA